MYDFRFNYPLSQNQHSLLTAALDDIPVHEMNLRTSVVGGSEDDREVASKWLSRPGAVIGAQDILIGAGGHNAMTAICMSADLAGQTVIADAVTYNGMKALAGMLHVNLVACPGDSSGMLPDALDHICSKIPVKAIYLMPTIHNPLCIVMPENRRREIAEVSRKHDLTVIDDDAYGFLEPNPPLSFAQLAPERSFYIYSFAKPISAGLKTSYIATPTQWQPRMIEAIRMTSSGTSPLMTTLLRELIDTGIVERIIQEKRDEGALRQQIIAEMLPGLTYRTHPNGFHFWLPLPADANVADLEKHLKVKGVEVLTSLSYQIENAPENNGLRIALGNLENHEQIREGLGILAEGLENTGNKP